MEQQQLLDHIKLLQEQVEMLTYERDFYRNKYETTQLSNFLKHFTIDEQIELLKQIEGDK